MFAKESSTNNYQYKIICPDDLVPQDNIYRKIQDLVDWDKIRSFFDGFYTKSARGRRALDPVTFVKIILIQYIEGFSSVRKTIEKIKVDYALRWFLSLGFDEKVPDHSTLSHLYHSRFRNSKVFNKVFNYILELAYSYGLLDLETVYVDSTHVKAHANPHKYTSAYVKNEVSSLQERIEEELAEAIDQDRKDHNKKELKPKEAEPVYSNQVIEKIREIQEKARGMDLKEVAAYNDELEKAKKKDPVLREALNWITLSLAKSNKDHSNVHFPQIVQNGELVSLNLAQNPVDLNDYSIKKVSKTDPESGWFHKGEHKHVFAFSNQVACDRNNFILSYHPFPGNEHDSRTFLKWENLFEIPFLVLVADAGYKTPRVVHCLLEKGVVPLLPYKRPMTKEGFFKKYEFDYDRSEDAYTCPEQSRLDYKTTDRDGYREYVSSPEICRDCPSLEKCTLSRKHIKQVGQHVWNDEMELVEKIRRGDLHKKRYPKRKETIERVFADSKENHHFRYTNYNGLDRMDFTCAMAFSAENLLKIIRMLEKRDPD